MELNSISYINESELVNVREIDIEVLLVGSRVIGVTHDCLHDVEESIGEDDDINDLMGLGCEFVVDYATETTIMIAHEWTDQADKDALIKAVKYLIAAHKAL